MKKKKKRSVNDLSNLAYATFCRLLSMTDTYGSYCPSILVSANNSCRDALILLKVYIIGKIQVKFNIGNHPQNFGQVMALFRLSFVVGVKYMVKILFPLNNF